MIIYAFSSRLVGAKLLSNESEFHYAGGELQNAIKQVVDAIAKNQAQKVAALRSAPRYNFNIPVTISAISASSTMKQIAVAWTLDMSYEGIGMLSEYKCLPKEIVFINFERVIGRPFEVKTEITHCKTVLTRTHRFGGNFMF